MNIQEYISSGIVESYVLGLTSGEESREFEELLAKHPEILHIKQAFEQELESYALNSSVIPPPSSIKIRFLEAIKVDSSDYPESQNANEDEPPRRIRKSG